MIRNLSLVLVVVVVDAQGQSITNAWFNGGGTNVTLTIQANVAFDEVYVAFDSETPGPTHELNYIGALTSEATLSTWILQGPGFADGNWEVTWWQPWTNGIEYAAEGYELTGLPFTVTDGVPGQIGSFIGPGGEESRDSRQQASMFMAF